MAARLKPGGDWAAALLAEAQLYQGREQEALAEAMAAEARWPRSVPVLATLGNILRRQQAAAGEADRYLQGALEIQPGQPDALYGLAILTALDDRTERSQWLAMLRAEPFSIRADRVRLGIAALESVRLSERGGPLWDLSRDGQRLLYYMQFRKQLEITDVGGFGLANQVTDQDSEKVAASLSPDEQYLAWVVADQRGDQLYVQGTNASGSHELVLQGTRGAAIRRTTWSPDSHLLLFTEVVDNAKARSVRLRCWDHQARREVEPPERLRLAGFGDAVWTAAGDVIGTVTDGGQQALVAVAANGEVFVLRPAARLRAYTLPAADATLSRVVYQAADLTAAPTDGSEGGEVPVMTGASSSTGALWTPDGSRLLVSVGDTVPTSVTMGGLADGHQVLARMEPLLAVGPRPTRLELRLRHRHGPRLSGHIRATTVLDDGTDGWTQTVKVNLTIGGEATASFAPPDATPGVHWLRVEVTLNDTADPPRWYRSEVVP
ncbi:MAG: hypothetical protein HUU35_08030 [Armatimonadetes bacterium]|nr:hypothetical protein [Armatimonadota bacterium]